MAMLKPGFDEKMDHFAGPLSAAIELVQYGDFQCAHCADFYPVIRYLREQLGDQLKYVFRHYPQPVLHKMSLDASVAAETAALQGKFWEMHDRLFEHQQYLTRARFISLAADIGLDTRAYEDNREHRKMIQKVIGDFEGGVRSGVEGTPTFFINGRLYNGFHDADSIYQKCRTIVLSMQYSPF